MRCQTHFHAVFEKTGAMISTNLDRKFGRSIKNDKDYTLINKQKNLDKIFTGNYPDREHNFLSTMLRLDISKDTKRKTFQQELTGIF